MKAILPQMSDYLPLFTSLPFCSPNLPFLSFNVSSILIPFYGDVVLSVFQLIIKVLVIMGNQIDELSSQESCPTHPSYKIQKICLCEDCLEPLCSQCVFEHHVIHEKLGYPARLEEYSKIQEKYKKKVQEVEGETLPLPTLNHLSPLSLILKDMTRRYFREREKKEYNVDEIIKDLQLWKEFNNDPYAQTEIKKFLKQNLKPNKAVLGEYSHLYDDI